MNIRRSEILKKIETEREHQIDVFGREWDSEKLPNDWISTIVHYASENIIKKGLVVPFKEDFEDSLVKACAVIIAALENVPKMVENNYLRCDQETKNESL